MPGALRECRARKRPLTARLLVALAMGVAATIGISLASCSGSDLSPGVTLRPIDGGTNYFANISPRSAWMDQHILLGAWLEQPLNATEVGYDRATGDNIYWNLAGSPAPTAACGGSPCRADYNVIRQGGMHVSAPDTDATSGMIEVARRDYPGARFDVGSMTDLALADASMAGLVAWYSLIHIPDEEIGSVLAQFHRVLRPGGPLLIGFHVGDGSRLKTEGYGGHPMKVYVHRRQHGQMIAWLTDAGFAVETHRTLTSAESKLGGIILARRPGSQDRSIAVNGIR